MTRSTATPVNVDGQTLTLESLKLVAEGRAPVALAPAAVVRMRASRDIIERIVASGAAVYGVTTGFGRMSDVRIPPEKLSELQINLVRSHVRSRAADAET